MKLLAWEARNIRSQSLICHYLIIDCSFYVVFLFITYFQVRDFQIAEREEDIGYYAGYVGELIFCSFSFKTWYLIDHCAYSVVHYYFSVLQEFVLTNLLIPCRVFIYAWQSFHICFLGISGWPLWSKTCYNIGDCLSVSGCYFHIKLKNEILAIISGFLYLQTLQI